MVTELDFADLPPHAKSIIHYIASLNSQDKDCYASMRGMVQKTPVENLRVAQKMVKLLKQEGWIKVADYKTKDGKTILELNFDIVNYKIVKRTSVLTGTQQNVPNGTQNCVPNSTPLIREEYIRDNIIIKKRKSENFLFKNPSPKGEYPDQLLITTNYLITLKQIADIMNVSDQEFNKFIDTTDEYEEPEKKLSKEVVSAYNGIDAHVAEIDKYRVGIISLAWGLLYNNCYHHPLKELINLEENFSVLCIDGYRQKMLGSPDSKIKYNIQSQETYSFIAKNVESMKMVRNRQYKSVFEAHLAYNNYTPKRYYKTN